MKNVLIVLFVLTLSIGYYNAQFHVTKLDGTPINHEDNLTFTSNTYPDANLGFYTYNDASETIYMNIVVLEVFNTDGGGMELCYGLCYQGVTEGAIFPTDGPLSIAPGGHQGSDGDHFLNTAEPDDPSLPITYVFNFNQTNQAGDEFIGDPITFTYTYSPETASVEDVDVVDLSLETYPNPASDIVRINGKLEGAQKVEVYSLEGKLVQSLDTEFQNNEAEINVNQLDKGIYLLKISDNEKVYITRIIKK